MPQDDDEGMPRRSAGGKPLPHQRRTDAAPLVFGQHGHRRQPQRGEGRRPGLDRDGAEKDMPYHPAVYFGHEREVGPHRTPQRLDEVCLGGLFEGVFMNTANRSVISRCFRPDGNHRYGAG